jgi:RNA recognition motif-containing protein
MSGSGESLIEVPVKLFVGRFPHHIDDKELSTIFEPFGRIKECTVLRDHYSGASKGCGFVRFAHLNNAIDCIRDLNGRKVLDPNIGPLQVQFANGEVERLGLSTDQVEPPPVKVFVGSLPVEFTNQMLHELFKPYGDVVETYILMDTETGRSKGSGFVKMRTRAQASTAISALNKTNFSNDSAGVIEVRLAVSRLQRQRKQSQVMNMKSAIPTAPIAAPKTAAVRAPVISIVPKVGPSGCNVFVFHIPPEWTEFHLRQLFSVYGFLVSVTVVRDKNTQLSRGFGFVSYDNPFSAHSAMMHMNGFTVGNKRLKVQLKRGECSEFALYAGG